MTLFSEDADMREAHRQEMLDDMDFEENDKQNHDWPWDIPNDIPYYGECEL